MLISHTIIVQKISNVHPLSSHNVVGIYIVVSIYLGSGFVLCKSNLLSLLSAVRARSRANSDPHVLHAWPDHGVPHNTMSLISFIRRVRKEHPTSLTTPFLVHCSAGVGRTGTFILLDLAMQQMRSQGTLSVFQHLKNMRSLCV